MIGTKVTRVCVFAVAICCFIGIDGVVAQLTIYEHCNYEGYAIELPFGDHDMNALIRRGMKDDDISSIQVTEDSRVVLYEDRGFQGRSHTVMEDESCFVGSGFNDIISSITVEGTDADIRRSQEGESGTTLSYGGERKDPPQTLEEGQGEESGATKFFKGIGRLFKK